MNQDKLFGFAKQAGFSVTEYWHTKPNDLTQLQRFAELVRAEALEDAAKVCEQYAMEVGASSDATLYSHQYANAGAHCAEAIRRI